MVNFLNFEEKKCVCVCVCEREREREMKKSESGGYVRADQIDLKSLDEQLQRHLSRAWTMEKNKEKEEEEEVEGRSTRSRQEWEIDPSKLVIKTVIARGTFGTVHRGIYDGQDVAGILHYTIVHYTLLLWLSQLKSFEFSFDVCLFSYMQLMYWIIPALMHRIPLELHI